MNITTILLIIVGVLNLLLGVPFFHGNPHSSRNGNISIILSLLAFNIALWTFMVALLRIALGSIFVGGIFKLMYGIAVFIPPLYLYFVVLFLKEKMSAPKRPLLLLGTFFASFLLFLLITFTDAIVMGAKLTPNSGFSIFLGSAYFLYVIYFVFTFGTAFALLLRFFFLCPIELDSRRQVMILFLSGFISGSLAVASDIVLPAFGILTFYWAGPLFTFLFVGFILYAIYKHQFLEIKIIGTELLVFIMWIFVLIQFLISIGAQERFLNGLILIGAVIFGNYIIRKVKREALERERFQAITNEIRLTNKRLKELDAQQKEFISLASHQLRTPLTAVRGYASMLAEGSFGNFEGRARDAIEVVENESRFLSQSVDNLLVASRIERGQIEFHFDKVDLEEVVRTLFAAMRSGVEKQGIGMTLEVKQPGNHLVFGDIDKLRHVITNLLRNAVRHTSQGFIQIKLEREEEESGTIQLAISDTGRGMTQKDIKYAFERVQQDYISLDITKPVKIGTGLFVSKELVSRHNGKIWVESPGRGKGSTFFIQIPSFSKEKTSGHTSSKHTKP